MRGGIGKETEGDAGIAGVDQIQKVMDKFVAPAFGGLRFKPSFGGAVEQHDGEREPQPAKAWRDTHEAKEVNEVQQVKEAEAANMLGYRHIGRAIAFDLGEGFRAAFADGRVALVFAYVSGIVPAALAFFSVGALDLDRKFWQRFGWNGSGDWGWPDFDLRNDQQGRKHGLLFFQKFLQTCCIRPGVQMNFGFESATDDFCRAGLFECDQDGGANLRQTLPFFGRGFVRAARQSNGIGE